MCSFFKTVLTRSMVRPISPLGPAPSTGGASTYWEDFSGCYHILKRIQKYPYTILIESCMRLSAKRTRPMTREEEKSAYW